jgi:hypothetical protein
MAAKHLTQKQAYDLECAVDHTVHALHAINRLATSAVHADDPEDCHAYLFSIRETACAIGAQLDNVHGRTLGGGTGIFDEQATKEAANG